MTLCLFRAIHKVFGQPNVAMRSSQISIECQRPFALRDALRGPVRPHVGDAEGHAPARMVRSKGQRSGRIRFGRR